MASGSMTIAGSEPGLTRNMSDRESATQERPAQSPLIKFARFNNATLELFESRIEDTDYIAFSHVWGDWTWRLIDGIPYEVKASGEKARFIANDLPALVGEVAFWMDTLTVDQRNPVEVSEIVDAIPNIFRMARKTIAVRECDGLYDCCIAAVDGFEDYGDFNDKLYAHGGMHRDHIYAESYLQRLWTLQECLLSHTIEFVVGTDNHPRKLAVREPVDDILNSHRQTAKTGVIISSLSRLAFSFDMSEYTLIELLKAYVHGGTFVTPRRVQRSQEEDIHSGDFVTANRASQRSATMPRDYIFATMPSFPWYTYPKKEALSMSFGEIYLDLYQQAARSGHAFTCKFTRSMLDPACTDFTNDWLPSQHLPSPTTLGDFMKLVGQRVPESSNASSPHVHITSVVQVEEFDYGTSPDSVVALIEACQENFETQWNESVLGNELPKFGHHASLDWKLDHKDAMSCGWSPIDSVSAIRTNKDSDQHFITGNLVLGYEEDDIIPNLCDLAGIEEEARAYEVNKHVHLFVQARNILQHSWILFKGDRDIAEKPWWEDIKEQIQGPSSIPLLYAMLLLAAMINCRVPLSAAAWVNKLFAPVQIHYGDTFVAIGLLAKHARQPKDQRQQPISLLCVGQHLPNPGEEAICKDLVLVDAKSKVPVGLVPDFGSNLISDEEYAKFIPILYNGSCEDSGENELRVTPSPLSSINP